MTERERRELADAHRGEIVPGSGRPVEPRWLGSANSARLQPPIRDFTLAHHPIQPCSPDKHDFRVLPGESGVEMCNKCWQCRCPQPPLIITGSDLVATIKAMAEFAGRLLEIQDLRIQADVHEHGAGEGGVTYAELYEARVAELADEIGEIRIEAQS